MIEDRAFYPHEADDPDLDWLISNFLFERPDYFPVESGFLPLMLVPVSPDFPVQSYPYEEVLEEDFE